MYRVIQGEEERRERAREARDRRGRGGEQGREPPTRGRTFVAISDSDEEESEPRGAAPPPRPSTPPRVDDVVAEGRERLCRICLDGETSDDVMISPCLCRGTSAYVHRECLNDWRRMSSNPSSFWRCDSCRYNYRTKQIKQLDVLKHPAFLAAVTTAALVLASCLGASALSLVPLKERGAALVYRWLRFRPSWRTGPDVQLLLQGKGITVEEPSFLAGALDNLFVSVFLVGLLGFLGVMYLRYYARHRRDEFMRYVAPSLVLSTANLGLLILRLFSLVGLFTVWTCVYHEVYQRAQKFVMRHGEVVLDIHDRDGDHGDLRGPVRRANMSAVQLRLVSFAFWLDRFAGLERRQQQQRRRTHHR
ncbi:hypothetical protein HOP50_18g81550 [Chloropicon primus]|uniref:RING-CH-type domain-containing protein n=1 Tax=Chloropicon primus TaxID=1764295 RepID=A0A5B8MYC5_9CHLO|nr:hypothetical protein A3770_18p81310 [Chloropicon primus]UPR04810.1 hypothetical protein HOP50_18g81550 [Chloropicon primus]|mmetsp:Transcript_6802/g.19888  ORF Transcript_6802/g.19888 Transcript_6802/m.19888 type:complete len:362 (+) Transcript_6802:606-1691(+)|eukprot:QDZ25613.1 hypothetical protein A3770_18p81310 [Chloropicon primus]